MLKPFAFSLLALAITLASAGPGAAQGNDPLTRFLNNLLKDEPAKPSATAAPAARPKPRPAPTKATAASAEPRSAPAAAPRTPEAAVAKKAEPASETRAAEPAARVAPAVLSGTEEADPHLLVAPATSGQQPPIPTTPAAAIERINAYFNSIDAMTASFTQMSNGQRSSGTLSLKRPGQLRFAYAPPSTLEIVSDGRSVAIRDKKLGTNDVYPIGQTPLKFLLQEQFDLARDTKVRNVQANPDGTVIVRFEDSATFGGTSKITLHFDARRNRLKEWTVVDPQGYETNVVLSDLNVVHRTGT